MSNNPYDIDMMLMIYSISGHHPEVKHIPAHDQFCEMVEYTWPLCEFKNMQEALEEAIKGRLGKRFHQIEYNENGVFLYFLPDLERIYPDEYRFDYTTPDTCKAERFINRVNNEIISAILFNKINLDDVVEFTGGGIFIDHQNSDAIKEYIFPKETGHFLKVKENEWIIFNDSKFSVMGLTEFNKTFKKK